MKHKILFIASLLGLLAGCSQSIESTATDLPVDYLSTAVVLTSESVFATSAALTPTATLTETPTPPIPVEDNSTATPTFAAGFTKFAEIQFISPGPLSSLVSPFNLQAIIVAGESERIQVDLLGEDGRVLQRTLEKLIR